MSKFDYLHYKEVGTISITGTTISFNPHKLMLMKFNKTTVHNNYKCRYIIFNQTWSLRSAISAITKDNKIRICCFSAMHAALRRKSKDWLARNKDNVLKWVEMSICGMLFQ
jgi:hypothetical protein